MENEPSRQECTGRPKGGREKRRKRRLKYHLWSGVRSSYGGAVGLSLARTTAGAPLPSRPANEGKERW
eukprot:scaffold195133_cov44-Tisochrysis_lutea.AAC.1